MDTPNNQVLFDTQNATIDVDLSKLEKLVRFICEKFQCSDTMVHIGIVDDAGIIEVHHKFLQKDTTTDVISFDLTDEFGPEQTFQIIVNSEMALRQAEKRHHSHEAELALYITHGLLHNLGFDDILAEDAKKIHKTEDEILQAAGFGVVYHKQESID